MVTGLVSLASSQGATGHAQVNLGGVDIGNGSAGGAFINFMKQFTPSGVSPAQFDVYQYPVGDTPGGAGSLSANYGTGWKIPAILQNPSVQWIITWPATRTFSLVVNVPVNVVSEVNCSSATLGPGGSVTIRSQGTAGNVVFNFTSASPSSSVSGYFESGAHYNGLSQSGDIVFMRVSDQAAYNAGAIFTPEWLATLFGLNPKTIRPMGWIYPGSADYTNEVNWNYRTTPSNLSFNGYQIRPETWGGTVSGTDATLTLASNPSSSSAAGWVNGEVLQGQVTNAVSNIAITGAANNGSGLIRLAVSSSTALTTGQSVWAANVQGTTEANGIWTITVIDSTHIDLQGSTFTHAFTSSATAQLGVGKLAVTGKSGGSKFIADAAGWPLWTQGSSDGIGALAFVTFIYDGVLDRVIGVPFGIVNTVPIEYQVALANQIYSNLWITIPAMANDSYVSNMVSYIAGNLRSTLKLYLEYGNEIWNNGFPLTSWSYNRGLAIGWPDSSNNPLHGWYGLRYRQIMGNVTAQWSLARGGLTALKRVLASKAFDTASQVGPQRLQGSLLNNASTTGNASGYTILGYTGGGYTAYNSAPNRPIDYCDIFSYATYYEGSCYTDGGFYDGSSSIVNSTLQSMATNYAAGGSGIVTALASLDADIRTGTGPQSIQTLLGLASGAFSGVGVYPTWASMLSTYGTGQTVECYEGGLQCLGPTASQCNSMGITATPLGGGAPTNQGASDQLAALLVAYLSSSAAQTLVNDQFNQARTGGIATPSWLSISGPSQWSFYPGDIFTSAPYQTYSGFAAWH